MASEEIKTEIAGTVWKIVAQVGDSVEEDDPIVILESMKMEMPIEAPFDGTVKEIRIEEGASVEEGQVLIVMEED